MSAVRAALIGAGAGVYLAVALWAFAGMIHYCRTEYPYSWKAGDRHHAMSVVFALIWPNPVSLDSAIRGHHRAHKEKQSDGHRQAETSDRDRGGAGDDASASDPGTFYATGGTLRTGPGIGSPRSTGQISAAYGLPQSIVGSLPANVARTMLAYAPPEAAPAEPLPTEQRTIPIVAWKQAYLSATPDGRGVQLSSTGWGGHVHQPEAVATCAQGAKHKAPDPRCGPPGCGFYALPSADQAPARAGLVQLEVELSGRVIEHERGFRAEKQRILSVAVDGQCRGFLCDNAPTRVVFPAEQVRTDYVLHTYGSPAPNWKPPFVCCDEHVGDQGDRAVTLDKLSVHLGVPVKWAS